MNVCKLSIAGATLFGNSNHLMMLVASLPIVAVALVLEWCLQPCIITWVNHRRLHSYMIAILAILCSILVEADVFDSTSAGRTVWGTILVLGVIGITLHGLYRQCTTKEYFMFNPGNMGHSRTRFCVSVAQVRSTLLALFHQLALLYCTQMLRSTNLLYHRSCALTVSVRR